MGHHTPQTNFWQGDFGREYTDRCTVDDAAWDQSYVEQFGKTKLEMNEAFLGSLPRDSKILEVGCNTGQQLRGFQRQGFQQLYGIELQAYAVEKAKSRTQHINILQGSGFDLPFRDQYFDLVCTNGVLIHIAPQDLPRVMDEMYRCTSRYIFGWEYFAEEITEINYRGHAGYLWKADYAKLFLDRFPSLQLVKQESIPFVSEQEKGNVNCMYLLQKT